MPNSKSVPELRDLQGRRIMVREAESPAHDHADSERLYDVRHLTGSFPDELSLEHPNESQPQRLSMDDLPSS